MSPVLITYISNAANLAFVAEELQPQTGRSSPTTGDLGSGSSRPRSLIYRGSLRDYMGLECASVSSVCSSLERSGEDRLTSQESDDQEPTAAQQQDKPAIVKMCLKSYIGLESVREPTNVRHTATCIT